MDELRLPFPALESDARAPRLKRLEIRAGRNFLVTVLAGQPDFDVVGLGRRETHVAGGQHDRSVRQSHAPQNILGVGREFFELIVTLFGTGKLYQLDFLELVLPDDASHVPSVRSGLAAEAGRVRAEIDRQPV